MRKSQWIGLALFVFGVAGCNYKLEKLQAPLGLGGSGRSLSTNEIDFSMVSEKVIQPKCLECHSASSGNRGGVNLESYAEVFKNLADVKADIEDGSMPKNRSPLSAAQKTMILNWIAAGAPELAQMPVTPGPVTEPSPSPTPTPPPTDSEPLPVQLDYASVKRLVLDTSCLKCHSAPVDKGDVNLESYQEVLKNIADIKSDVEDGSMPRRSTLTPEQKSLILDWIAAGAPEVATGLSNSPANCDQKKLTQSFVKFVLSEKQQNPGQDRGLSSEEDSCLSPQGQ